MPWRRAACRSRGQALVELTFILPVMLFLTLAAADFGRAYYAGVAVMHAAREGARWAARNSAEQTPAHVKARVLSTLGTRTDDGRTTAIEILPLRGRSTGGAMATTDIIIHTFDTNGTQQCNDCGTFTSANRASGFRVDVEVRGFVPFFTGFLVSGVSGWVPGFCPVSTGGQCGIPVTGTASMVVF